MPNGVTGHVACDMSGHMACCLFEHVAYGMTGHMAYDMTCHRATLSMARTCSAAVCYAMTAVMASSVQAPQIWRFNCVGDCIRQAGALHAAAVKTVQHAQASARSQAAPTTQAGGVECT